jgi:hypothetical protein
MEECVTLAINNTWDLVPRTPSSNVINKWAFMHKFHANVSLECYKAHWVCQGFTRWPGIDYDETFSPVVKPGTDCIVLSLGVSQDWSIHQLNIKNVFLHGTLSEVIYCRQLIGFVDPAHPDSSRRRRPGTVAFPPVCRR